jgi:hypothetical protein
MVEEIEYGVIIDAALDNNVDLDRRKPGLFGCGNTLQYLTKISAAAAHGPEDVFVETIQADRDAM